MVARIDLDRLARLRTTIEESAHAPATAKRGPIVLWDSAVVTDLMPMIDRPIANLTYPEGAVLLSHRRRNNDPISFTTIMPSEDDAAEFHATHGDSEEAKGTLKVTPHLMRTATWTAFEPDYIVWALEENSIGARSDVIAVFGDVRIYNPEHGMIAEIEVCVYGTPFRTSSFGMGDKTGPVDPAVGLPHVDISRLWAWVSGFAQNLAWCIQHPDQFPITIERGDRAVTNRGQIKAARKAGLDLNEVRVVELRPHEVRERPGDGGSRRAYQYSFPVRGHWRHLPNGESVWVAGYWKATDKPRVESVTVHRF